jgi:hypothetical protein
VRPKGVADGHTVNIPWLLTFDKDRCGDADATSLCAMVTKRDERRSGQANPPGRLPGKSAKENGSIRTTNRHRWSR